MAGLRLIVALGVVVLVGCGGGEAGPAEDGGPWVRIDLWRLAPQVEQRSGGGKGAVEPFAAGMGWLGGGAAATFEGAPAGDSGRRLRESAPRVRVIEQEVGSRLAWSVEVPPGEPYLGLTPLGALGGGCLCILRAGVRDADGLVHELYRTPAGPVPPLAPAAVEIDLAPFAGTRLEVLLQVDAEPGGGGTGGGDEAAGRVLWASPAVYGRAAPLAATEGSTGRPVDVLLIVLAAVRWDAVGARSPGPSLTPHLDALAAESDVWDRAFATADDARSSLASILTGLYAKDHGAYGTGTPLSEAYPTLAERFAAAGYDTHADLGAGSLEPERSGLGRGFAERAVSDATDAAELVAERAMEWFDGRGARRDGPWFAWLYFADPEPPHLPPQPYGLGFRPAAAGGLGPVAGWLPFRQPGAAGAEELYQGEVAYLDRQLGRLLGFLDSRGALEDTVVAVVADRGSSPAADGVSGPGRLGDAILHVPLLVRWPDRLLEGPEWLPRRGRRFGGLVQTLDLFPTLLAAAGLEAPPGDGVDLRRLTPEPDGPELAGGEHGAEVLGRRWVFAERADGAGVMVRTGRWKLVAGADPDGRALYDLEGDPGETVDLAGTGLEVEARLAEVLDRWRSGS